MKNGYQYYVDEVDTLWENFVERSIPKDSDYLPAEEVSPAPDVQLRELNNYFVAMMYSDQELKLMLDLSTKRFNKMLKRAHFMKKPWKENKVLESINTVKAYSEIKPLVGQFSETIDRAASFIDHIAKRIKNIIVNLGPISSLYLVPGKESHLIDAEQYLFVIGHIDENGHWQKDLLDLAALLKTLEMLGILRFDQSTVKEREAYFSSRYSVDLNTQLKPSKLAKNGNFGQYGLLIEHLKKLE